jgi:hypothetical protein
MIFIGIIQSLQDFIFEILVWIVFLPKTLLQVLFKPRQAVKYVNAESEKTTEQQFDEYLHPAFFFLAAVIFRIVFRSPHDLPAALTEEAILKYVTQDLLIFMFYLAWLEWLNNRPLKRSTLKRLFHIQCYILGSVQFLETLCLSLDRSGAWTDYVEIAVIALIVIYESAVFREELKTSALKSVGLAVVPLILFFMFLAALLVTGLGRYVY